jgi:hypothetical protein
MDVIIFSMLLCSKHFHVLEHLDMIAALGEERLGMNYTRELRGGDK